MTTQGILIAFIFTLLAGLATGLGGLLGVWKKQLSKKVLSLAMGFSAGLLLFTAFAEVMMEGKEYLGAAFGEHEAGWIFIVAFFGGTALAVLISALMPEEAHHHHHDGECCVGGHEGNLQRTGFMTMLAIGMHNFPEGIALFTATAVDIRLGVPLMLAIALHNIPIGLSISMPVYAGSGKRAKAILMATAAGMVTPIGALAAWLLFGRMLGEGGLGIILAAAAGIMVYAALSELYPCAREQGGEQRGILSLITGMIFMALILQIFH